MQDSVHSPHQIDFLVRWLKARVEHDEGGKWRRWLGERARNPLWLLGQRGVWGYRREANGEHGFSVSDGLLSPEASDDVWWWYIFHPDAGLGGSLMMSPAPDHATDITLGDCTDQWRPYFDVLLEEMKRTDLAVAPAGSRPKGAHGDTLTRVKDARQLIEQGECKTTACKRAHIDSRTYDRYLGDVLDWTDDYQKVELS